MAGGTINGSTGNQYIDSKIVWSSVANNDTNKSSVTAALYYKRNNTGYTTSGTGTFAITIAGVKTSVSKYVSITEDAWVKVVEDTVTVSHDADGGKDITISASGSIPDTTLTSTTCKDTVSLDTIPRASTIASAAAVTLGNACSVKWTPAAASFRYKLKFTLGDWSYTTGAIHPNTTAAYTYKGYKIPLTVANQLPKAKTGTMTVTLYTYSNSAATTRVGDTSSKTFTVTVPNNSSTKPTVDMDLAAVHSLGSAFAGLYIQGKSRVQATISAEGKYGADISSYKMYALGKTYSSPYKSGYLSTDGTVTVKGRAYDSRGYYNDYEQDITVIPYKKPEILPASGESAIICARCDSEGNLTESGTYLKIKARRSYSKVKASGVQKNFCLIRYRYRAASTNTFSDWKTILAKTTTSTDTVETSPISGVVSSAQTTYYVQIGVADDIGESAAVQITVPSDFITIDIPDDYEGRRIGLFRYVAGTTEDGLYVGLPIFGGSVDSLKIGTRLTATEAAPLDLDDIKTPGCYYSPGADYSQYIVNTPYTGGGFGLEVRELQSKNYISQTMYYGRSRWVRHWNTTEWSEWIRFLMTTVDESICDDFVIDEGTANGWTYKKWKSGTFEMFGIFTVTATSAGTEKGTLYYSEQFKLPAPFWITDVVVSGTATNWFVVITGGVSNGDDGEDPNENVGFRLYRPTEFAVGQESSVRLHVTGKYE